MKPSGLTVSVAPHLHCGTSTSGLMQNQILALVPAAAVGVFFFGLRSLLVIGVSIITAVVMEMLMNKALKVECTLGDFSAVLAGLLLALLMPANVPLWTVAIGAAIMIVVAKWLFGGLGAYAFNPVIVSVVMLSISWPRIMSSWNAPSPIFHIPLLNELSGTKLSFIYEKLAPALDKLSPTLKFSPIVAGSGSGMPVETTLEVLKKYGYDMASEFSLADALIGMQPGGIGAVAALALIVGGVYLIARGVISWHIPVGYIVGIVALAGIFRIVDPSTYACPGFHLLSGMTLMGIFFLAPEYSTSPNTVKGKLLYGLGIGLMTMLIRLFGKYPDGTLFAIMLMNLCTPLFDRLRPRVTGLVKEVASDA